MRGLHARVRPWRRRRKSCRARAMTRTTSKWESLSYLRRPALRRATPRPHSLLFPQSMVMNAVGLVVVFIQHPMPAALFSTALRALPVHRRRAARLALCGRYCRSSPDHRHRRQHRRYFQKLQWFKYGTVLRLCCVVCAGCRFAFPTRRVRARSAPRRVSHAPDPPKPTRHALRGC